MKKINGLGAIGLLLCAGFVLFRCSGNPLYHLGVWKELAPMPRARQEMPGVHWEGKIYVAGGMDSSRCCNALSWFDAYNIDADSWKILPDVPVKRNHIGMAALDNKIYVIGGWLGGKGAEASNQVYRYDIERKTWSRMADMPNAAAAMGVVVFNKKIYVFGGSDEPSFDKNGLKLVQEYDPIAGTWQIVNDQMPYGRSHIGAGRIGEFVYLSPGRPGRIKKHADDIVQEFNFNKMFEGSAAWRIMNRMPGTPRTGIMCSWPVINGTLYYMGGEAVPDGEKQLNTYGEHHAFTPDQGGGTWRRERDCPIPIHGIGPVSVGHCIYVMGGGEGGGVENKTDRVFLFTNQGGNLD